MGLIGVLISYFTPATATGGAQLLLRLQYLMLCTAVWPTITLLSFLLKAATLQHIYNDRPRARGDAPQKLDTFRSRNCGLGWR